MLIEKPVQPNTRYILWHPTGELLAFSDIGLVTYAIAETYRFVYLNALDSGEYKAYAPEAVLRLIATDEIYLLEYASENAMENDIRVMYGTTCHCGHCRQCDLIESEVKMALDLMFAILEHMIYCPNIHNHLKLGHNFEIDIYDGRYILFTSDGWVYCSTAHDGTITLQNINDGTLAYRSMPSQAAVIQDMLPLNQELRQIAYTETVPAVPKWIT